DRGLGRRSRHAHRATSTGLARGVDRVRHPRPPRSCAPAHGKRCGGDRASELGAGAAGSWRCGKVSSLGARPDGTSRRAGLHLTGILLMRGLHLTRIAGIDVTVDWSLLIIFALITASLASGLFPQWHPAWGPATSWLTAVAAAVLFFASVLAHELSHSLVGRAYGVQVKQITLFVFGGMAQIEHEPGRWPAELWMAIVGPVTSLVIGVLCVLSVSIGLPADAAAQTSNVAGLGRLLADLDPP